MSRLNFSPVENAFNLGSKQIKDTKEEIAHLTKLILESNNMDSKKPKQTNSEPPPPDTTPNQQSYARIGYPDKQTAIFRPNTAQDDIDYNLMKVIGHPKFDDIVRNYALINHPEWLLKEVVYTPVNVNSNANVNSNYSNSPNNVSYFGGNRSNFGNQYQSTVCSDVKNYVMFFLICMIIFLSLTFYFK
uniref:Uncharacterized protein n=1 Tax=viral metagenome TaxID=1070528 RepID=A0A6C0B009_9ZZZZ